MLKIGMYSHWKVKMTHDEDLFLSSLWSDIIYGREVVGFWSHPRTLKIFTAPGIGRVCTHLYICCFFCLPSSDFMSFNGCRIKLNIDEKCSKVLAVIIKMYQIETTIKKESLCSIYRIVQNHDVNHATYYNIF